MPLLDHFHPPLYPTRHWESLHGVWASAVAGALNARLPPEYFAEIQVHVGSRVEIDVATVQDPPPTGGDGGRTATATLTAPTWSPPAVAFEMPAVFPDSIEVQVFSSATGATLVAAVEFISPGNKDRAETRRAFAAKCAAYLQQGIGVLVVDIVTNRQANLHNELVRLLEGGDRFLIAPDDLYTTAYRPVRQPGVEKISVWAAPLAVGQALPVMPLALDRGIVLPVDLEATYTEACQRSRLAGPRND